MGIYVRSFLFIVIVVIFYQFGIDLTKLDDKLKTHLKMVQVMWFRGDVGYVFVLLD